jgi:TonB family protein
MKYILYLSLFSSIAGYAQEIVPPPPVPLEPPMEIVEDEVFDIVEASPEYPGGMNNMMQFITNNFQYPQIDLENGIQGRVYVSFVVERDGSLSTIKVLRGVSETLDAEAIRIIKLMPNWIPGEQAGKTVRVKYTLPIRAHLK